MRPAYVFVFPFEDRYTFKFITDYFFWSLNIFSRLGQLRGMKWRVVWRSFIFTCISDWQCAAGSVVYRIDAVVRSNVLSQREKRTSSHVKEWMTLLSTQDLVNSISNVWLKAFFIKFDVFGQRRTCVAQNMLWWRVCLSVWRTRVVR